MHDNNKKKFEMKNCDQCEYKSHWKRTIRDHKLQAHEGKLILCGQCDKKFAKNTNLNRHISFVHNGNRIKCDQCDFKAREKTTITGCPKKNVP